MRPSGVIYQSNKSSNSGEYNVALGIWTSLAFHLLRGLGTGLIAFGFLGIIFSFWPIVKEEFLYRFGTKEEIATNKFSDILEKSQAISLGLDPNFSIFIPKIDAKANIIPNVNAGEPAAYLEALSRGVAHAAGTNFPGSGKTIYLFSHSTDSPVNIARFNAVFYLLRKMEKGDRIVIFYMGKQYLYIVQDKYVTGADDTSWLDPTSPRLRGAGGLGERLILQTCDPPGTSWNRLLVVARPLTEIAN